jgi:hypothetical protein
VEGSTKNEWMEGSTEDKWMEGSTEDEWMAGSVNNESNRPNKGALVSVHQAGSQHPLPHFQQKYREVQVRFSTPKTP